MTTRELPAGLGWRFGARIIDVVALTWLVVFVLVEIDQRLLGGDPLGQRQARLGFDSARSVVLLLVIVAAYEVVPAVLWGATAGKALLGLRIRLTSRAPGALMALGRAAVLYLPLIFLGVFGLVVVLVLLVSIVIAADGRGLHDRLLGTLVVSLPREDER
ncbi:MAG: RDD family protein [Acidimicrobiales bacterium]|nr:RDD family protein [Acidimicrobiales bacterium]